MEEAEELKEKIIKLIDESKDNNRKIAFYGDERVTVIMDKLYKRWEEAGRRNKPIDYATYEELKTLARLAEYYSSVTPNYVVRKYFMKDIGKESSSSLKRRLYKSLKKLFIGGK